MENKQTKNKVGNFTKIKKTKQNKIKKQKWKINETRVFEKIKKIEKPQKKKKTQTGNNSYPMIYHF